MAWLHLIQTSDGARHSVVGYIERNHLDRNPLKLLTVKQTIELSS